jgi:MFS family permease
MVAVPRFLRALEHREFRVIWACFLIGQGGFWLSQVTVQVEVVQLSGGDALRQGLLVLIFFAPQLVLTPIAGVLADRYDRVRVMALAQALLAVVAVVLAAITFSHHVGLAALYVLSGALGLGFAVIGPTGLAVVGQAVPARDIASAVALQSVAQNLARVAGPALAVPVVLLGGPGAAFACFAVLATATVALLWPLKLPNRPQPARGGFFANLAEGFAAARSRPPTLLLLSMVLVVGLFGGPFMNVFGPVLAVSVLRAGANGYFVLVVASGAGAAVGVLATALPSGPPRTLVVAAEMVALGLVLAGAGLASDYWTLVVFSTVYGAVFFALMATIATTIQHLVVEENRGRIMSLYAISWGGAIPPGALLLGYLAHEFGVRLTLLAAGAAVALYALAVAGGLAVRGRRAEPEHDPLGKTAPDV